MYPILPELMPDTLAKIITATNFCDWPKLLPAAQRAELEHLDFAVAGHCELDSDLPATVCFS